MPQSPTWPAGKSAAISLTYDDGHDSLVEMAMPDLEAAGLRGTMYLNTGSQFVLKHAAAWKAGQLRGHEMGNHSVTHPWRWTPKIDTNGNPASRPSKGPIPARSFLAAASHAARRGRRLIGSARPTCFQPWALS